MPEKFEKPQQMQPKTTPKRTGGMLLRLAGTILTLVLLVFLLSQQGWQEIWQALQRIPLWQIFLAFILMIASRFAVAIRWYALLRMSNPRMSAIQSIRLTYAGLFASNFLPTTIGGDVVRLAGAIQLKLDPALSTASLVVDRLVGMAGMLMVAPLGLPSLFTANQTGLHPLPDTWIRTLSTTVWGRKIWETLTRLAKRFLDAISIWRQIGRAHV